MAYVAGDNRHQASLLPSVIDDYVDAAATVRVVDAFVDSLDFMALGFGRAAPASTGRPGYDPRDLLKLYVYGYLNEVRSSRRLERECKRNIEVMWLVRRLAPDHKTVADFRRDNGAAIVGACRAFVLFCHEQGIFAAKLVAIDGSKFRAVASPKRVMDRQSITEAVEKIDAQITHYLSKLDSADANENDEDICATATALNTLRERRADLEGLSEYLDQEGRNLVVEGENDARPMASSNRSNRPPRYNVQIAVDANTGFIIHHAVTDEVNDARMLHPMAKAVKELLGQDALTVVADTGYSNGNAAAACDADQIIACVPVKRSVNHRGTGDQFDRSHFAYDSDLDHFTCPAGQILKRQGPVKRSAISYVARNCLGCELKSRCTQAPRRWLSRHEHEDALERMSARVADSPKLMRHRRCSVEHPFGTIKRMSTGRFLTRGIKGTSSEMALSVLVYNMIRSINLQARPN
jgi:transposase